MKTQLTRRLSTTLLLLGIVTSLCLGQAGIPSTRVQADASVFHVTPSGSDAGGCGSEASPCQTIQYAVNQADSGDTILVAGGQYLYNSSTDVCSGPYGATAVVCVANKQLTILGGYSTSNWWVADPTTNPTVIDGQNYYRGVWIVSSGPRADLRLEGFVIQGGLSRGLSLMGNGFSYGGGMLSWNAKELVLRNVVFKNNKSIAEDTSTSAGANGHGGGLAILGIAGASTAVLEHITFQGNEVRGGAGSVRGGFSMGGGLFTYQTIVYGSYITFTNNLAVGGSSSGSGVSSGMADAQGGGAAIQIGTTANLQYVTATGNRAIGGNAGGAAGGAYGGGLYTEQAALALSDANVRQNVTLGGNGTDGGFGEGGGILGYDSSVTLDRVTVISNTASGGDGITTGKTGSGSGGGIALIRDQSISAVTSIANSIVADNTAKMGTIGSVTGGGGGGIWLQGVEAGVAHTTVARNHIGRYMLGQGIVITRFGIPTSIKSEATISYSIIADHTGLGNAGAALVVLPQNSVTLVRGLWANNDKNDNSDGIPTAAGNFYGLGSMLSASSVGFISPGAPYEDYHISLGSPAKEQAVGSSMSVDIDNEPRVFAGDAVPDIGADEHVPFPLIVSPVSSGALRLEWKPPFTVDYYSVLVSCGSGAAPPTQGACDSPIYADGQKNFMLTGLTNFAPYTMTIQAWNSSAVLIATSKTVVAVPANQFVYLPLALR